MNGFVLKTTLLLLGIFSQASGSSVGQAIGSIGGGATQPDAFGAGSKSAGMDPVTGKPPPCPEYFFVPLPCRMRSEDFGFCYNPDLVDPKKSMADQKVGSFQCLAGLQMGNGQVPKGFEVQCPPERPKMCLFTGSQGGIYNDLMLAGFFLFPCSMILVFYYNMQGGREKIWGKKVDAREREEFEKDGREALIKV